MNGDEFISMVIKDLEASTCYDIIKFMQQSQGGMRFNEQGTESIPISDAEMADVMKVALSQMKENGDLDEIAEVPEGADPFKFWGEFLDGKNLQVELGTHLFFLTPH